MNDSKFFTNEPGQDLYSRFCTVLNNHTQFFDILVGYFRTSGFFRLYEAMESVEKIRILVGLNVDKHTVEIIDRANSPNIGYTIKQANNLFSKEIASEFEDSETVPEVEQGVRKFIEWLKTGKLEMRMYTKAPIHAKVYIMRKDPQKADYFGNVITGSSNFSESGLRGNLEFNVELRDRSYVQYALGYFEKLWEDGIPIQETFIETIEKNTWLRNDITPYEIYLKTLYEFFGEEINSDKEELAQRLTPKGYMHLRYQIDAVIQAKKILETYNGVFISDVVGLGKTYICAMLAKSLGKGKKLIICPPVLTSYWEEVLYDFDVSAKVVSLGKLDSVIEKSSEYEYVFIDEAHRFRNANTESFGRLHEICYGKKIVLVTATPLNNYTGDIESQIYLFQPRRNSNITDVKNLESFFSAQRKKLEDLPRGTKEYMDQIKENSEEIRDKILRHIMIRRTRTEIERYYHDDLEKQGLSFPKLDAPEKIVYAFNEDIDTIFNTTLMLIGKFTYARYKPLTYLKDTSGYGKMTIAQINIGGFMKCILLKRLESSFYAFQRTLWRFIDSYKRFINMYNTRGEVWISKNVDVYEMLDNGDIEKLWELVENDEVLYLKKDLFKSNFIVDLTEDLAILERLNNMWASVDTDPKLETFLTVLRKNEKLHNNKKIIFTESKETAEYLEKNLRPLYQDKLVSYSGESNLRQKEDIEKSFNPKYESSDDDPFDVLITTDVLSEGINLHRSNALINYDLPWNPTKIMQRVGRINRVGTKHAQIHVFNFFPTAQADSELDLKDRILAKLQSFHDTFGEDYKYLSDEEEISTQKLFDQLTGNLDSDEESTNPELAYLKVIRNIRDNDEPLFEKIKNLPAKAKVGRLSDKITDSATITFIQKGALKDFYITREETDKHKIVEDSRTERLSFIDAVKYIECPPNEKRIEVESSYFDHYNTNNKAFDDAIIIKKVKEDMDTQIRGNDAKMLKYIQAILSNPSLTDEQIRKARRILQAYENGDIPKNITKNIINELKDINDTVKAYYVITDCIPVSYLYERKDKSLVAAGQKRVILSCYMKGISK